MAGDFENPIEGESLPADEANFEQLLDDHSHFAPPAEGEVLQGYVVKVTSNEVIVDFGFKSEGLVPIDQFEGKQIQRGETIDVMVDRTGVDPEGYVLLSHTKAVRMRAWDQLEKAMEENLLVNGRVTSRTKGGRSSRSRGGRSRSRTCTPASRSSRDG